MLQSMILGSQRVRVPEPSALCLRPLPQGYLTSRLWNR
jgi:hypothetical protein